MHNAFAFPRQILGGARLPVLCARLALGAAALCLALVAYAHLAPGGRWAERSDVLTPFTGHMLIGAGAAYAALWLGRHEYAILVMSVAIAVVGHAAWARAYEPARIWAAPAPVEHTTPRPLRLFAHNSWDDHPDLDELTRALEDVDADVMVLAEVDSDKLGVIAQLEARYPYKSSCAADDNCAMALLSRFPIVAGQAAHARYTNPPIAWARIDAHAIGLGEVTIVGTHVFRPSRDNWLHARQMDALTELALSVQGPLILAGDFNAGPWTASFQRLIHMTALTPSATLLPTWPAYPVVVPQVALDNILVSRDLAVVRSGLGPPTGSDHLPVFAEIKLR